MLAYLGLYSSIIFSISFYRLNYMNSFVLQYVLHKLRNSKCANLYTHNKVLYQTRKQYCWPHKKNTVEMKGSNKMILKQHLD